MQKFAYIAEISTKVTGVTFYRAAWNASAD